jgi:hypothetical protein
MDLSGAPAHALPVQPQRLKFTLREGIGGRTVSDLAIVHTKKMHLILTNADLSYFDHVHPIQQPDGSLILDYSFPRPGEYLMFADITPAGRTHQVFRLPIRIAGRSPAQVNLRESDPAARLIGDYRVELKSSPPVIRAGDETTLEFNLSLRGRPVMDLEPYLGAYGHSVSICEDSRTYLHSHPLDSASTESTGPQVTFHANFPHSGLYKTWAQFQHKGRMLTADFVIRVH